ncbi:MAG: hypothetical protein Greene041619_1204 [Candidatus Peregrinibacteria bacterium Greene0416_19]|nr:MAG: hypothetical protein Greene041619_1204 [Candidatus Peregrinibacteria bacterium Greene0416_19]
MKRFVMIATLMSIVTALGCGGVPPPKYFTVKGKVQGIPSNGTEIFFASTTIENLQIGSSVQPSGEFEIPHFFTGGKYAVYFKGSKVPKKYLSPRTSGLTADIGESGGEFTFTLQ